MIAVSVITESISNQWTFFCTFPHSIDITYMYTNTEIHRQGVGILLYTAHDSYTSPLCSYSNQTHTYIKINRQTDTWEAEESGSSFSSSGQSSEAGRRVGYGWGTGPQFGSSTV